MANPKNVGRYRNYSLNNAVGESQFDDLRVSYNVDTDQWAIPQGEHRQLLIRAKSQHIDCSVRSSGSQKLPEKRKC